MRIHLPLHPQHFVTADAGPSAPPLARIGGELVVVELQGELAWEGNKEGGVIGVLGLDRPDKPTLHIGQHHLLHGKMANLPRPYAVIRKAANASGGSLEGDMAGEESDEEHEAEEAAEQQKKTPKKRKLELPSGLVEEAEGEDDAPPFPEAFTTPSRPTRATDPASSSPWNMPSSSARDYSSDLDSSPAPVAEDSDDDEDAQKAREEERKRKAKRERRKAERPERSRHYEVVGVVRKKVVFALRPEPLVQPTPLPE